LQTSGSQVQWSPDGSSNSWQNINVALAAAGQENTFTFQMSGAVYLESFTGAGGDLTFRGAGNSTAAFVGPSDLHVDGNLSTLGGSLTINNVQGLDVQGDGTNPTTSAVTVSTQNLDSSGHSQGSSGAISINVANTDPLNPTLYVNFTDPHITIGQDAKI